MNIVKVALETPQTPTLKSHPAKKIIIGVLLGLILIALGGLCYWQYRQINDLHHQVDSITSAKNSLAKDKAKLTLGNTDLTKAVEGLQVQVFQLQTQQDNTTAQTSPTVAQAPPVVQTPPAAGSMTINSIKKIDLSTLSNPVTPITGQAFAVDVTIKNLTSSTQQYVVSNFNAIAVSGELVQPEMYAGPYGQNIWSFSSLAAGGSKEITLLFNQSLNLTSLVWSPPGGSTSITETLPALTN